MYDFLQKNELNKTLNRFNKIRLYHNNGYNNLLPAKIFKKYAHNYQQIQLNTNFHFNAIIMDIDDENLLTEWNLQGLPTPTIQTINKANNKAHLVWLLNTPIWKEHKHAVDYYMAIANSIKKIIGADVAYQNHQTKNFLNTSLFRVVYNDIAYNLGDFKKFILKNSKSIEEENKPFEYLFAYSRHIYLFERLRKYGYKIAKEQNLKKLLTRKAEYINQKFHSPIKVKYIVDSVYKFCEKNRENFRNQNRKRVMNFDKIKNLSSEDFAKEVKKRQSKAASRTSLIKKQKTSIKIKIAIDFLMRHKKDLNFKNISKRAKISTSTVRRYTKIIKFFIKKTDGFIRSIRLIVRRADFVGNELSKIELKSNFLLKLLRLHFYTNNLLYTIYCSSRQ